MRTSALFLCLLRRTAPALPGTGPRRHVFTQVAPLLLVLLFYASPALAQGTTPQVVAVNPSSQKLNRPSDLKTSCPAGPETHDRSPTCPVIKMNGYTYWAYSYRNNSSGLGIVAYDAQGNQVKRWDKRGTRYLWKIDVVPSNKTVVFYGQGNRTITMTWAELMEGLSDTDNLSGEYRIRVQANGRYLHEDGLGDRFLSTRYQVDDDFTRFILERQSDGSYRIRVQANGRYLHEDGLGDRFLSTRHQVDDDFTRFILERQSDGSYRIRVKANGRYLHEDGLGDRFLSTRYQVDDDFTRFYLEKQ